MPLFHYRCFCFGCGWSSQVFGATPPVDPCPTGCRAGQGVVESTTPVIFVLGAPDAEMAAIEAVLPAGSFTHAMAPDGTRRATPAECATGAASFVVPVGHHAVLVEVAQGDRVFHGCTVVDHHGKCPQASLGPRLYWSASSLGQVYNLLGLPPTREARFVAAADHCLRDAFAGRCPGVDPEALFAFRVRLGADHAAASGRPVDPPEVVIAAAQATKAALVAAPALFRNVRDMRRADGKLWGSLPDMGAIVQVPYVAGPLSERDGRKKLVVSGDADDIRTFGEWATDQGLTGIYMEPTRGLGGAYIP